MLFAKQKPRYRRRAALVLINGLAEQAESWYCNVDEWRKHFEVHTPNLLIYDGDALHRRIDAGAPIDIDYLVEQLRLYVDSFVQRPPVHLVANSMGGKIAVEFAARYPDSVAKLVLLCPSGLSREERLPVVEGVRRNDPRSLIDSVFQDPRQADPNLLGYYQEKFSSRKWRGGLMRAIRGTMKHRVVERLSHLQQPTLLVVGQQDRIVNPAEAVEAAQQLPRGEVVVLPSCGHAPQIEEAATVNRLVVDFLSRSAVCSLAPSVTLANAKPQAALLV
ncbi:MAG: alpha/beta hydrolase [Gemmataceae bacterium]|nr:alpha/beta hydrolase [Gemmataceae bacterium]